MEKTPASLLLLLLLAAAAAAVEAADCPSHLADHTANKLDFNVTTSFTCENVWDDEKFVLAYTWRESTWSFVLTAPETSEYIGIGFSRDGGMVGSSAVVGWLSGGRGAALQYYLAGKSPNEVVPNEGNLTLVKSPTIKLDSDHLYLAFQLTSEQPPSGNLIFALGPENFTPASDRRLRKHSSDGEAKISYRTSSGGGPSGSSSPSGPAPRNMAGRIGADKLPAATLTAVAVLFAGCFF